MTQQVFADYIGQSPATLSSIFNGRTRPTLNIVEAIKKKIPNISTDWLMFGSGDMYLTVQGVDSMLSNGDQSTTDSYHQVQNPMLDFDTAPAPTLSFGSQPTQNPNSVKSTRSEMLRDEVKYADKPQRKIMEIRVFYDDQTYDTFIPSKK